MLQQVEVYGMLPASPPSLVLPIVDTLGVNPIQIRDIDGIQPVKSDIFTSPTGSLGGELYSGSSVGKRNIVFKMGLNPDWHDQTIESLRAELYRYFMPQLGLYLRFISTHLPTCEIQGYVESMDPNIFAKEPEINVSIICPRPDFISIDERVVSGVVSPDPDLVDLDYVGNVPTGFVLRISPGPTDPEYTGLFTAEILNNGDVAQSNGVSGTVDASRDILIGSVPGDKFVHELLIDGDTNSLLSTRVKPWIWMQLFPGIQQIRVKTIETGLTWSLSYFDRFGGL